jgi:hypothetical protein
MSGWQYGELRISPQGSNWSITWVGPDTGLDEFEPSTSMNAAMNALGAAGWEAYSMTEGGLTDYLTRPVPTDR